MDSDLQNSHKKNLEFLLKTSQGSVWKYLVMFVFVIILLVVMTVLTYDHGIILDISKNSSAFDGQVIESNIIDIVSDFNKEDISSLKVM